MKETIKPELLDKPNEKGVLDDKENIVHINRETFLKLFNEYSNEEGIENFTHNDILILVLGMLQEGMFVFIDGTFLNDRRIKNIVKDFLKNPSKEIILAGKSGFLALENEARDINNPDYEGMIEALQSQVIYLMRLFPTTEYKNFFSEEKFNEYKKSFMSKIPYGYDKKTMEEGLKIFNFTRDELEKTFKECNPYKVFEEMVVLNNYVVKPLDEILRKDTDIFGNFASHNNYKTIKDIESGNIYNEAKQFGVNKTGEAGITQFEQGFAKFRSEMLKPDFDTKILQESELARDYFKNQIRFNEAEWAGDKHTFLEMLVRYIEVQNNDNYEKIPLNPAYTPSEIIRIDNINKDSQNNFEYSESFLNRFKTVFDDVWKAKELCKIKSPLTEIVNRIEEIRKVIIEELEQKIEKIPNPKGQESLKNRLELLKSINLRSLKDFQNNFKILATFKEFEPNLRQAMFVMGFEKNRNQLDRETGNISVKNPQISDISWVLNFVDHVTNKETMSQYFTDKQARDSFRSIINVKSFEEELARLEASTTTKGTTPFQFIPTRGILMEFSGHIADACWADKYEDTIPATFPNFTAITMVQNPNSKHERLCGSCMLIETIDEDTKEPLLVIRGLNPIQNTINELKVEDFYNKFTNYCKILAEKTGRKLAIVVDGHTGGSCTNRPVLFNYLVKLIDNRDRTKRPKRINVSNDETEFNGYDISRDVWLIE